MYFRPGNLLKSFRIKKRVSTKDNRGRLFENYQENGDIRGVLASTKPSEKERWSRTEHPVSHTITQYGMPKAVPGDRLIHGSRIFYIQGVDNIGEFYIATIYYAEERTDQNVTPR